MNEYGVQLYSCIGDTVGSVRDPPIYAQSSKHLRRGCPSAGKSMSGAQELNLLHWRYIEDQSQTTVHILRQPPESIHWRFRPGLYKLQRRLARGVDILYGLLTTCMHDCPSAQRTVGCCVIEWVGAMFRSVQLIPVC